MEENSNIVSSSSLFPAYASSSSNQDKPTSLFPAYNSQVQNDDRERTEKEWLCNSSYSPSHNEAIIKMQEEACKDDIEEIKLEKKEHVKKKKKDKDKKYSIPHPSSYNIPESVSIRSYLKNKTFIEETGLSFERAFRIDSKSDPENMHYEHLEQKYIARYLRTPKVAIGLNSSQKDLWPRMISIKFEKSNTRYFHKKALKLFKTLSTSSKKINQVVDSFSSGINLPFIPLASVNTEKVHIQDFSKKGFDGISYSWKEPTPKSPTTSEENTIVCTERSEFRNKTIYFNEKLSKSPQDVELWLEFLDFQDESNSSHKNYSPSEYLSESALIEKKIAILDKALGYNPKSVVLNVFKLNLCRSIWKLEDLIKCWDELIFLNPNNVDLWQEYLAFILTNVTYFTTPRILKLYSKCINTLSNMNEGITQSHIAPSDIVPRMLDVFSQMCFVLKSCGYMEKAVAAFQALIELNLFTEEKIKVLPISDQISFLEPFWDSGSVRFGENGAIGWAATISEMKIIFDKIITQSDLSHMEDDILNGKFSENETWIKFEQLRALHHWLPWRPNPEYGQTDDDIDDTERTISFDTVSKFLFRVSKEEHKFLLLLHFLHFLGFNPHDFGCSIQNQNTKSTYIDITNYSLISNLLKSTFFKTSSPLCFETENRTIEKQEFINNVFTQALCKLSQRYKHFFLSMKLKFFQECALSNNESFLKIDDVKKFIKSVLKESENRNCLRLWFEYIKVESLGSKNKGKKTFEGLMTSSCQALSAGSMTTKELWYFIRSYLDFCFGIQNHSFKDTNIISQNEAISLLVCVACKENYAKSSEEFIKPVYILKAVSNFKHLLQEELMSFVLLDLELCSCIDAMSYSALDCAKCFAFFQYFTHNIDAAMDVLKDVLTYLETNYNKTNKKYVLEQLTILQADLLNFHTWNSNASLKPLQTLLQESVFAYPNCSKLLFYLIKLKSASSVVSSTRRFFVKVLKKSYELQPNAWIFAIASELWILNSIFDQQESIANLIVTSITDQSFGQGINWKIRSLYETALKLQSCSYIPILWRSYLKFEMLNNELDKAKSIYYRALQNCCWCKDLLMDGVEYFPDNMKQAMNFMIEKQMRVHAPLEEITLLREHGIEDEE